MTHPLDFSWRLAAVTDGGAGLGRAMARGFASTGARVMIDGRNRSNLDAAASGLLASAAVRSVTSHLLGVDGGMSASYGARCAVVAV